MSLVSDIQELLESSSMVFWTASQIYDAANQAQLATWKNLRHDVVTTSLSISTNDKFVSIPAEMFIPQKIIINDKEYFITTQAKLEQDTREWRSTTTGQPKWFVLWDALTLRVYPTSDAAYTFTLVGVRYPAVEISGAQLDLPAQSKLVKNILAHRAASIVLSLTRPDLADAMEATAKELESQYLRQARNSGGHRIDRIKPGSRINLAKAGILSIGRSFS